MSLFIDPLTVTAVLLADGWHDVYDESFELDTYEFGHEDARGRAHVRYAAGGDGGCSVGFRFAVRTSPDVENPTEEYIAGPMTSVLAVRHHFDSWNPAAEEAAYLAESPQWAVTEAAQKS